MTTFLTLRLLRITQGKSDSQNQKLPRIWIRIQIKMIWIRNTEKNVLGQLLFLEIVSVTKL